jgi:hypothetical protein
MTQPREFIMTKLITLITLIILTSTGHAEHYEYKARVLLALSARLTFDVKKVEYQGTPAISVRSKTKVHALGANVVNMDYEGINDAKTFSPFINIECEHSKKRSSKNCRSVKFLPYGDFLYKRFASNKTELKDFALGDEFVTQKNIIDQLPEFNPNEDLIYDVAALALLVKYLDIAPKKKSIDLHVAINESMAKINVSHVKELPGNQMWIKLTPVIPAPHEFKMSFPHKIIYDRNLKAVTEIHQKLPIVGNTVVRLDRKASRF